MGRNDLCFCGSGKKQKRCHPDIKETSVAAKVIKLYDRIDRELNDNLYGKLDVKCKKGCNKCCEDYFAISEVEFSIIMYYLYNNVKTETMEKLIQKGIAVADKFKANNPEFFAQLEQITTGMSKYDNLRMDCENMPEKQEACIFLDEEGGCGIYSVRPIICRTHGVCYFSSNDTEYEICDIIPSWQANKINMLNIEKYRDEIFSVNLYQKEGAKTPAIQRRKYPIFYFMKMYFADGNSVLEYFKSPTIQYILHETEDMLYDMLCRMYQL